MQRPSFCAWFISAQSVLSQTAQFPSLYKAELDSVVRMSHIVFLCTSVHGHLGCLRNLAIVVNECSSEHGGQTLL